MKINGQRLLADLASLSKIGRTAEGGVNRPALSRADFQAREWFQTRVEAEDLIFHRDEVGNLSAILPCREKGAQTILCGSHLDTVPNGGRYDGALGVIAGLEVLRTIKEDDIPLQYNVEVISFTDEEGAWHGSLGSLGFTGRIAPVDFERSRGNAGKFKKCLLAAGIKPQEVLNAKRDTTTLKAWVEVHIEQGSRLEETHTDIGIVTEIVGIANIRINFKGRADHSGTTFPSRRKNALLGLANFVLESQKLICDRFPQGVLNCGVVVLEPNVVNIVPAVASITLEVRHPNWDILTKMQDDLLKLAAAISDHEKLILEVDMLDCHPPATMNSLVISAIETACKKTSLTHIRLPSYAGHDTQVMSSITPSGMFFVPSVGGASHCPREFTREEDCIRAGEVLLQTILELAN